MSMVSFFIQSDWSAQRSIAGLALLGLAIFGVGLALASRRSCSPVRDGAGLQSHARQVRLLGRALYRPTWAQACMLGDWHWLALDTSVPIGSAAQESAAPTSTAVVRVQHLHCTYGDKRRQVNALRDVSFALEPGQRLVVVGRSGAGKSSLLRCLNLLVTPTQGSVEIHGTTLTGLRPRDLAVARQQIGMVFQHFALLHRRTVRQNIALPLELAGLSRKAIDRRVDELLALVRLTDKADAYPAEISGGQKQRVGIARALAHEPRVLLCDEPTSALDVETAHVITALLKQIADDLRLTVVCVSHQIEFVRGFAHQVAVLDDGQLCELTPSEEFLRWPRSAAGQRLVAPQIRTQSEEGSHDVATA